MDEAASADEGAAKDASADGAEAVDTAASGRLPSSEGVASSEVASTAAPEPLSAHAPAAAAADALERLLRLMAKVGASDLHLKVGAPPLLRVASRIQTVKAPSFQPGEIEALIEPLLDDADLVARMRAGDDLDLARSLPGIGRFRLSIFRQRGSLSVAIRRVQTELPSFAELHLPVDVMQRIAAFPRGLVLVCGVTGSGKSTTLAALIERINETRRCHIVTIEDPIEFLYRDKKAFVNQREVGIDVPDFATALRHVVRQDPDVILLGELRDRETFESALQAAETGHLVFGTLHSGTVAATIGRILDLFPPERERQVRQSLRFNLRAVICQRLLPGKRKDAALVPALEILLVNATAEKIIAEGDDKLLEALVRGGREEGMIDFASSLAERCRQGFLTEDVALGAAPNPDQLRLQLRGISLGDERRILGS